MTDQLIYSLRLASPDVDYPLTVRGAAEWLGGAAAVRIDLPDVPAHHIITASFASASTAAPFSFRLDAGRARFETARFGARTRRRERSRGRGAIVPVDYFETQADLARPVLSLRCKAPAPRDYLLAVSIRPKEIAPPDKAPADNAAIGAPCLSQLSLAQDIRLLACSPTATSMALGIAEHGDFEAFVASARHRSTGLYGAWPQNIWAAARQGVLAAIELATDWQLAERVLASGVPLVASIRFGAGELAGSPSPQTGGHLVLLRGVDRGAVVVNDPAAAPGQVERRYAAAEFAKAWIRQRGVAYVFARSRRTVERKPARFGRGLL